MLTQVYRAQITTDERGGLGATLGYFRAEAAAQSAARGQGWYGGDGRVTRCCIITADGHFYPIERGMEKGVPVDLLDKNIPEEAKRRSVEAWSKIAAVLDPVEIELLGLKEPKA